MATCNSLWRHVPGTLLSCLIRTIVIFNKIFNINRKCPTKLFAATKLCNTYTICPSFCSLYCSHSWPSVVAWGDKSLHTYSKPWNKHHRLEGLLRFKKPIIRHVHRVLEPVTIKSRRKIFVYKRKKRSINNQTTQYNENDENTTVKDLQRRATFKRCVTKWLWFIWSVFCQIDKKIVTPGKDLQRRATLL